MRIAILFACTSALLALAPAVALAGTGQEQYIVVLKTARPNGAYQPFTDADIARLGGKIDFTRPDRVVVTLPESAAAALRQHPSVKYVQKIVLGAGSTTPQGMPSILRITAQSATFRPAMQSVVTWSSGTYTYDGSGNITAIGLSTETGVTPHTYKYDVLSRLTEAVTGGALGQTESFAYDVYANMTRHDFNSTAQNIAVNSATNRLGTGYAYDAAGNLTQDATATYAYDPMSQMREKDFTGGPDNEMYVYTADDQRIGVKQGDTWTWSVRDFGGDVLRQYQSSQSMPAMPWLWVEDYVYREGVLLGAERVPEEGGRRHFHVDHLGTPRLVTGSSGMLVASHELAPFGTEINPQWSETTNGFDREEPMRFTGHERDFAPLYRQVTTAYLDYMHARYYSPFTGRFLSVDPLWGHPRSPQSWNRYAYALNRPLTLTDPLGLYTVNCASDDNVCQLEAKKFRFALRDAQTSRDAEIRAAAATYGKEGVDNGVHVWFRPGDNSTQLSFVGNEATSSLVLNGVDVNINPGQTGTALEGTIVHEGDHVGQKLSLWQSMSSPECEPSGACNLSQYASEFGAYMLESRVANEKGAFAVVGPVTGTKYLFDKRMTRDELYTLINRLLASEYNLTPDSPGKGIWP